MLCVSRCVNSCCTHNVRTHGWLTMTTHAHLCHRCSHQHDCLSTYTQECQSLLHICLTKHFWTIASQPYVYACAPCDMHRLYAGLPPLCVCVCVCVCVRACVRACVFSLSLSLSLIHFLRSHACGDVRMCIYARLFARRFLCTKGLGEYTHI
jgi:hypothetical protein